MRIVFQKLPKSMADLKSMPELDFSSPFHVSAVFAAVLCAYATDKEECHQMIDILKGPQRLSAMEKQFIHNRMMGKAQYIGQSYFVGATPGNDYTPTLPYTVIVDENPDSYAESGYATVHVHTGGADRPRPLKLRQKGEHWYLWDHTEIFTDIRKPIKSDPWR